MGFVQHPEKRLEAARRSMPTGQAAAGHTHSGALPSILPVGIQTTTFTTDGGMSPATRRSHTSGWPPNKVVKPEKRFSLSIKNKNKNKNKNNKNKQILI